MACPQTSILTYLDEGVYEDTLWIRDTGDPGIFTFSALPCPDPSAGMPCPAASSPVRGGVGIRAGTPVQTPAVVIWGLVRRLPEAAEGGRYESVGPGEAPLGGALEAISADLGV